MLLFVLGITLRDKEAQKTVYYYIGPLYGYFESVVLVVLLATGSYMLYDKGLLEVLGSGSEFATIVSSKLILVGLITFATVVHMYISLKAHGRERSQKEKIISRATSLMIFFLNLVILWFAIQLRNYL
jgi:hypothetical protein